jgi:hypothetical protein
MLLPIGRSEEGTRVTAIIVYALIIANVLVFLMELAAGDDFISGYSVVPWEITHGEDLTRPVHMRGIGTIRQAPGPMPKRLQESAHPDGVRRRSPDKIS